MATATTPTATRDEGDLLDVAEYGVAGRSAWLDVDWRSYLRSDRIGGRTVNYVQCGDPAAPTAVLIHGLAGCWQNWLENIPALAEDFNVIAIDLPGFGGSAMPAGELTIGGYARVVVGLLGSLGVERAAIIGNSMGGQVAVQTAIDFGERVSKLILVSPAGYSTCGTPRALARGAGVGGALLANAPAMRRLIVTRPRLRTFALGGVVSHPELLSAQFLYEMIGGDRKIGFAAASRAILEHDFRGRLGEVDAPTLIVWGRNDRIVTSRDAERFARSMPRAKKLVLRDTGHCAMAERPAWFNATAREFLLAG